MYVAKASDTCAMRALQILQGLGAQTLILSEEGSIPDEVEDGIARIALYTEGNDRYRNKHLRVVNLKDIAERGFAPPMWTLAASTRVALKLRTCEASEANFSAAIRDLHSQQTGWKPEKRKRQKYVSGHHHRMRKQNREKYSFDVV